MRDAMRPKTWSVNQDRGSWWATVIKGDDAPVGHRMPVLLIHPRGEERGSGVDWRSRKYLATPNDRGAWWQRGGFSEAVRNAEMVLLRKSLGHDDDGVAIAGGPKIAVFRISSVEADEYHFTFTLEERIAEVA